MSNCLHVQSQLAITKEVECCQRVLCLIIEFGMINNFRIQAVMVTYLALPSAHSLR
jgi:hypothetical protein